MAVKRRGPETVIHHSDARSTIRPSRARRRSTSSRASTTRVGATRRWATARRPNSSASMWGSGSRTVSVGTGEHEGNGAARGTARRRPTAGGCQDRRRPPCPSAVPRARHCTGLGRGLTACQLRPRHQDHSTEINRPPNRRKSTNTNSMSKNITCGSVVGWLNLTVILTGPPN